MHFLGLKVCLLVLIVCIRSGFSGSPPMDIIGQAFRGSVDMWRAYNDMRQANWKGADKYFHARGNYDAARRGLGGKIAAEVLSNAREMFQGSVSGRGAEDTRADQIANQWGRNGGNPNFFRPPGLPSKY